MLADRNDGEFSGIHVRAVDWPIVLIEFPAKSCPDEALHSLLDYLESLMREAGRTRGKLFVITDFTQMREIAPAKQRHYTSNWMKRTAERVKVTNVAGGYVTPSPLVRGVLTAVFWLQPQPIPSVFVATRREAMLAGIRFLETAGMLLPPRLMAYRDSPDVRPVG